MINLLCQVTLSYVKHEQYDTSKTMSTYYLTYWTTKYKILSALISIFLLVLMFTIFARNDQCIVPFALFMLVTSFRNIFGEHITISDNGIEYHRLGLTFNPKWENIKEINEYWSIPFKQEGIYIDPDLIRITEWWLGSYTAYGGWNQKAFIPLSIFSENWRNSELGQQIKHYVPHLFEKEKLVSFADIF